ncbi:MAG: J domain-containing protein [Deltaproteobacteria bacterium]|jgi:curved DNA-binding protein CbpA|nr:J domain-containing protein [Deltaproteobacteria bacterium]
MFLEYFQFLGLTPEATFPEIRQAYLGLVRRYPPELFPNKFQRLK